MNFERYPLTSNHSRLTYEFLSEGPKGTIKKVVIYQKISAGIYNLAFGDWDEKAQKIIDNSRSNNNDRDKVLASVASTVIDFMNNYPEAIIFAKGITPGKTRLYQIGITQNWHEIGQSFDIEGFYKGNWEPFQRGRNYEAFTLKAK